MLRRFDRHVGMGEGRENIRSSQRDLFAWREWEGVSAETVGHEGAVSPRRVVQICNGLGVGLDGAPLLSPSPFRFELLRLLFELVAHRKVHRLAVESYSERKVNPASFEGLNQFLSAAAASPALRPVLLVAVLSWPQPPFRVGPTNRPVA